MYGAKGDFTFHNVSITTGERENSENTENRFTFHNVSITTTYIPFDMLVADNFTFHNVSITTIYSTIIYKKSGKLYIPQCLYYNPSPTVTYNTSFILPLSVDHVILL